MEIIRNKQFTLADKIFYIGVKEFAIADIIRALQTRQKTLTLVQTRILKLVAEEQKEIIEMLQNLAEEERNLFNLFIRAVENRNIDLMQEISFKENSLSFKFSSLGFKESALADKIRATLGLRNLNNVSMVELFERGITNLYGDYRFQVKG